MVNLFLQFVEFGKTFDFIATMTHKIHEIGINKQRAAFNGKNNIPSGNPSAVSNISRCVSNVWQFKNTAIVVVKTNFGDVQTVLFCVLGANARDKTTAIGNMYKIKSEMCR